MTTVTNDFEKNVSFLTQIPKISKYEAEADIREKVSRVCNNVIFGLSICGAYSMLGGSIGLLTYPSYISSVLFSRKILSATITFIAYPASKILPDKNLKKPIMNLNYLDDNGFIVRKIQLFKSGIKYEMVLLTTLRTALNGIWILHGMGSAGTVQKHAAHIVKEVAPYCSNIILINGPSVGDSNGWPTRYQMGAGYEAGLQFLENEIKATHIMMWGFSLGGGMLAEAILQHDFTCGLNENIQYLYISDRTFSKMSTTGKSLIGSWVEKLFYCSGMELDGIEAAKKMSQLKIRHIIIQHQSPDNSGSDTVIPDKAGLAYGLHKEKLDSDKLFLESEKIPHNGKFPLEISETLRDEIKNFSHSKNF
jgi:Chlamydia CHLPS protein (DUF818)